MASTLISSAVDFAKLMGTANTPMLSDNERKRARILIVDSDASIRNTMRQALVSLAFSFINDASDYQNALLKLEDGHFTHIIFDIKKNIPAAKNFLHRILDFDDRIVTIPSSYEPTLDDVFELLIAGARGYLVKPFTSGGVDEALAWATKGEPISEAILHARTRNEALASLVLNALDKLAIVMAQARQFETAKREIPQRQHIMHRAVEVGKNFANGGVPALFDAIVECCVDRAEKTSSRSHRRRSGAKKGPKKIASEAIEPLSLIGDLTQS